MLQFRCMTTAKKIQEQQEKQELILILPAHFNFNNESYY